MSWANAQLMMADSLRIDHKDNKTNNSSAKEEVYDLSNPQTINMLKKIANAGR